MQRSFSPLVSIVIPVYNGSNYLAEAIDSALAQTYQNVEILVVNDGSEDGGATRGIALSYGDRIRYFEKENGGVSTALNLGIEKMRGEYFSWLSHDDLYYPEKIEAEIKALRNAPSKDMAVYSNFELLVMPGGEIRRVCSAKTRFGVEIACQGLTAIGLGLISGCTLLIPKTYFETRGLFEPQLRMAQDYECWLRFFGDRQLLYVDQIMVQSRVHDAQQGRHGRELVVREGNELYCVLIGQVIADCASVQGIGKYELISALTCFTEQNGYLEAYDLGREWLRNFDAEESLFTKVVNFEARITNGWTRKICIYCAGKRGVRLSKILTRHGIKADCFSDSNPEKWGKVIEGLPCVSPESLEKERYTVIVTKLKPEELVESLRERGFSKVLSFDEIEKELLFLPIPKRYL